MVSNEGRRCTRKRDPQPAVNEVCSARQRSPHYGAYRGAKPQECLLIIYLTCRESQEREENNDEDRGDKEAS